MKFSRGIFGIVFALIFTCAVASSAAAQDASERSPNRLPQSVIESEDNPACRKTGDWSMDRMIAERCIKAQRKEYDELLQNGEEAVKLSAELDKAFERNPTLIGEDQKKLERLEKVFKKIRSSLGAEEEDEEEKAVEVERPTTVRAALSTLSEKAAGLLTELKKTSRYSISVVAVQSSNAVLRLVRFIRFSKN